VALPRQGPLQVQISWQHCNVVISYQLKSLDFVINRFFIKLFRTSNML